MEQQMQWSEVTCLVCVTKGVVAGVSDEDRLERLQKEGWWFSPERKNKGENLIGYCSKCAKGQW